MIKAFIVFNSTILQALRCSAEKNHISYFSKRIEFLMRRYLDTESGKAEVTMLMQVVRESENRKYLSLRDPSDESEVTKEIDSIHNNRKMVLILHFHSYVHNKQVYVVQKNLYRFITA